MTGHDATVFAAILGDFDGASVSIMADRVKVDSVSLPLHTHDSARSQDDASRFRSDSLLVAPNRPTALPLDRPLLSSRLIASRRTTSRQTKPQSTPRPVSWQNKSNEARNGTICDPDRPRQPHHQGRQGRPPLLQGGRLPHLEGSSKSFHGAELRKTCLRSIRPACGPSLTCRPTPHLGADRNA